MQTIQFKENQKDIWNEFIAENNSESFLQAWEWGKFQKNVGRDILRIGVVGKNFGENNKEASSIKCQVSSDNLLAVALIIKYNLPFGQSYLYCPRGPIISQKFIKSKVVNFLFSEIKKIAKKKKAIFLKIDPPISCWFHSGDGPVEPKCKSYAKGSAALLGLWSQHCNFKKSPNEIQPKNTLILDLTKSEEELLKEMKPKTRYNIRLAERKGVKIGSWKTPPSPPLSGGGHSEPLPSPPLSGGEHLENPSGLLLSGDEQQEYLKKKFEKFWKLVEETSVRDKFASHNRNYYWKMLESLNGKHTPENPPSPLFQRGNSQEENNSYCLQAKLYLAEYKNKTIAANIVLSLGDFCVYLHGASSNEHRNAMAPYLLQWRQILDAKKTGCQAYDFWGVSNNWSGITKFKKGFGGEEKNYIGAYDLVFSGWKYYPYKVFRKIKTVLKSIKYSV